MIFLVDESFYPEQVDHILLVVEQHACAMLRVGVPITMYIENRVVLVPLRLAIDTCLMFVFDQLVRPGVGFELFGGGKQVDTVVPAAQVDMKALLQHADVGAIEIDIVHTSEEFQHTAACEQVLAPIRQTIEGLAHVGVVVLIVEPPRMLLVEAVAQQIELLRMGQRVPLPIDVDVFGVCGLVDRRRYMACTFRRRSLLARHHRRSAWATPSALGGARCVAGIE